MSGSTGIFDCVLASVSVRRQVRCQIYYLPCCVVTYLCCNAIYGANAWSAKIHVICAFLTYQQYFFPMYGVLIVSIHLSDCLSVCLSVCPSVCL